jgi:hypothetical protein
VPDRGGENLGAAAAPLSGTPRSKPSRCDVLLALVGVDEDPRIALAKATAFRALLLGIIAVELWERARRSSGEDGYLAHLLLALLASFCASAVIARRAAVPATAIAAAIVAVDFAWQFPATANHQYLQLLCLGLLLLLREGVDEEVRLLGVALRWLLVIGLFYAGLQKLLYGYYFEGEFLAFTIPQNPRFAWVLEPLMPAAEFDRIRSLSIVEGAGPFRVDSAGFIAASNLAYLAELALPLLLLIPRTRAVAVLLVVGYFGAIEAAAREVFFGGIMVGLALLFWPGDAIRRALPIFYLALGYLLAVIFGWLPSWVFT